MRGIPQHFTCDVCAASQHVDLLCVASSTAHDLLCVHCCPCHLVDDPGGVAVFAGEPLRWRGLDGTTAASSAR